VRTSTDNDATAGIVLVDRPMGEFDERELRYRAVLDALPAAIYTTDTQGRITFYNEACVAFAGRRPQIGDPWCVTWRLYRPDGSFLPHDQCPMAVALQERRPVRGVEAVAERPDGSRIAFIPYPTPIYDRGGRMTGAVNMLVDITHRKEAEERLKLLTDEVNHRAHNLLSVIQATVRITAADTVEEYKTKLEGRIQALGRAHSLIAASRWEGADLQGIVTDELAPYLDGADPRARADGPPVPLDPTSAQSMALLLHELATNAAKHGALSTPAGRVVVEWRRDPTGALALRWVEASGFPVARPSRSGVGSRVIARAASQLGGKERYDWTPGGLVFEVVCRA
jgi:PAS domain S-box-containing protein